MTFWKKRTITEAVPRGWLVVSITDGGEAETGSEAGLAEKVIDSLRGYGLAIVRNVLDRNALQDLVASARLYSRMIRERVESGREFDDLDEKYRFYRSNYAADLTAIDPKTCDQPNELQFPETQLFKVLAGSPILPLIERVTSIYTSWSMARVRIVFPDRPESDTGALAFHQEKIVTKFAGLHNLWIPLVAEGLVTNRDTPGIQFFVGDRAKLVNERNDPKQEEENKDLLATLRKVSANHDVSLDQGRLVRPHLTLGDVVLFDAHVPHATYLPPNATEPRVSFDIRLFPTPSELGPKPLPFDGIGRPE